MIIYNLTHELIEKKYKKTIDDLKNKFFEVIYITKVSLP